MASFRRLVQCMIRFERRLAHLEESHAELQQQVEMIEASVSMDRMLASVGANPHGDAEKSLRVEHQRYVTQSLGKVEEGGVITQSPPLPHSAPPPPLSVATKPTSRHPRPPGDRRHTGTQTAERQATLSTSTIPRSRGAAAAAPRGRGDGSDRNDGGRQKGTAHPARTRKRGPSGNGNGRGANFARPAQ